MDAGARAAKIILSSMKEGKLSYIGKGNNFISIVHPKDVAKCLRLALERDKNGDIFNVVSFTCKIKEFFQFLQK